MRVQVLRISWDTKKKRWFYLPPPDVLDERLEPGDPLHWTGVGQNWNHTCADCHSINVHKGFDLAKNTFHTTYSEIDVGCEACHGPGSLHVELAGARSLFWDRRYGYGLAGLADKESKTQIDTCAKCHSRRSMIQVGFKPGDELLDYYEPALLDEGLYYADGQILDEVYVYGSFLQSKMYRQGVRCSDCHDPHTARLRRPGNRLCTECHLPGKYDTPAHHHHPADSTGAACVECHMPDRYYMVVDPRRDHSLRVPRPDLSVRLGTPNACTATCHTKEDETAAWAAAKVVEWYGKRRPDDPHYAPALAAARQARPEGKSLLLKWLRRQDTSPIVRATALSLLVQYPDGDVAAAISAGLTDADPLVRTVAVRSVGADSPGQLASVLVPMVADPVRSVRIAAANRLAGLAGAGQLLTRDDRRMLSAAIHEYEASQRVNEDRAAAHINLGNLYQNLGQPADAAAAFRTAIRLEPYLTGPRSNLALLLERTGGSADEVRRLRVAERQRLARDAAQLPDNPWIQERYGLLLYLLGDLDQAQAALKRASVRAPDSHRIRMELTLLYEKQKHWPRALESAKALVRLRPDDPAAAAILRRIERQVRLPSQ